MPHFSPQLFFTSQKSAMLPRNVLCKLQNFPSQLQVSHVLAIRPVLVLRFFLLIRIFFRLHLFIDVITNVNAGNPIMLSKVDVKSILHLKINLSNLILPQVSRIFKLAEVRLLLFSIKVEAFKGIVQDDGLDLAHLQESLSIEEEGFSTLHSILSMTLGKDGTHLREVLYSLRHT